MLTDIWYGGDCETRIGRRPNLDTPPASWQAVEFLSLTVNPAQEWRTRNKLGNPGIRQNVLDPTRPRKGFFRLTGELVLDADTRQLPMWLRYGMGAPTESIENGDLFDHVFESGSKAEQYFDLAVRVGENDIRIYEGLTFAQISTNFTGESTQDFNINISLAGLRRRKAVAFPAGTVTPCPAEAPVLRALFKVNDVEVSNVLSGSFSYSRSLQEGIYLSPTVSVSSLRPNGAQHTGSATYRAIGAAFDAMEEAEVTFAARFDLLGVVDGQQIALEHPQALLAPSPVPIDGVAAIERSISWSPYQTAAAAAARIVITNDVEGYA
ncbi:phage tail tube protein [Brevundimonas sp.]|uniref:phage tail tube protein n=1 Tax=Brevundimonas sp. TaxID=1871086 RepID=UPI00289A6C54|nr:phage tail tube protein [Brevundimonas sp.]